MGYASLKMAGLLASSPTTMRGLASVSAVAFVFCSFGFLLAGIVLTGLGCFVPFHVYSVYLVLIRHTDLESLASFNATGENMPSWATTHDVKDGKRSHRSIREEGQAEEFGKGTLDDRQNCGRLKLQKRGVRIRHDLGCNRRFHLLRLWTISPRLRPRKPLRQMVISKSLRIQIQCIKRLPKDGILTKK